MKGDLISAKELERKGIDGDEIDYSIKDKEIKMSEPNIAEETQAAIDAEKEKFLQRVKTDAEDLIEAIVNDDGNPSYYVRRVRQVTGDYLYHENNNFSELIEKG